MTDGARHCFVDRDKEPASRCKVRVRPGGQSGCRPRASARPRWPADARPH